MTTREQAIERGLKFYDGKPCKPRGHRSAAGVCRRYTSCGMCVACAQEIPAEKIAWRNMISRCYNKNDKDYHRYGGRGVTVCKGWRESYETFLEDVGKKLHPDQSLERFENDDPELFHYRPENVVWSTRRRQTRNKTTNRRVRVDGRLLCLADAAKTFGISPTAMVLHAKRHGVSLQQTANHYKRNGVRSLAYKLQLYGKTVSLSAAARHFGVTHGSIRLKAIYHFDGNLQAALDHYAQQGVHRGRLTVGKKKGA